MDVVRFQKVKDIFAEAVELSSDKREDFLREKCVADVELFEEVNSLLSALDEPENLIEKNALSLKSYEANANIFGQNYTGKRFGNYEIVREIGRGGMGAVFLAKRADGEFNQKVALKIVRQTILDAETERRFRREREILAALNHPNIARLYDGGDSDAGEAFLAMEYVEGETLLEFAENRNLSTEARLKLFLKICAAVSYAHQNLTVHRDLKPSNILVTSDGEPKLLDFGLAKMTESTNLETSEDDSEKSKIDLTETLFRAFTPAYASPEQILGKNITTASDIYSLGVVFYELLSGEKPFHFEGKSLEEIIETLTNSEPKRPSSLVIRHSFSDKTQRTKDKGQRTKDKLHSDIDNIALKALQKEPERRYQTVQGLANDIELHLNGLPILARPANFSYRAAKFFKRNQIAVSAAIIVFLSIMTGLIFTLWQANETRKQRDRAEKRFNEVRKLSNTLLSDIAPKIERLQGSTEAREILVKNALEYLDSLAVESQNDDELQSELASAYEKIGDLQGNPTNPNFIEFEAALKSYEKANQMRRSLVEKNGGDLESNRKLAENFRVLGNIYSQTNDIEVSSKNTLAALRIYDKLVEENPSSNDLRFNLAKVNYDFGLNLQSNKKHSESLAYFEKAKNLLTEINREKPNQLEILQTMAEVKIQNAYALSWAEKQTEAETEASEATTICERLLLENSNNVSVRGSMWLVYWLTSGIYQEQNDKLAYEFAQKALKIVEETVARDGANIRAKQQLAKSFSTLGQTATTIGKSAEAIFYLEKSCKMLR
ncbi:MAG TPA: protein kinase, partial [Pyrinomonadaceae bacterium]|nr:protein kinase [Pyrinomonadaceae bacterium]